MQNQDCGRVMAVSLSVHAALCVLVEK